jgi:uncharacterized protein YaiI (UPF0178 family)
VRRHGGRDPHQLLDGRAVLELLLDPARLAGAGKAAKANDLVVTADIPLAAAAIEKGGFALNPRGELYTKDTIRERLSMRNFMDELRSSGVATGGPPALGPRDKQAFANSLDALLTRMRMNRPASA